MLRKHFSMRDSSLRRRKATKHPIELRPGSFPFRPPPYWAGTKAREMEDAEVQRLLAERAIRPFTSEWASPVVIAPKSDCSSRFCVNYRHLNALTKLEPYLIPPN